jgi:hypothetical protein
VSNNHRSPTPNSNSPRRNSERRRLVPVEKENFKKHSHTALADSTISLATIPSNSLVSPYSKVASVKSTARKGNGSESTDIKSLGLPPEVKLFTKTHLYPYFPELTSGYTNCKMADSFLHFLMRENASLDERLFISFAASFGNEVATEIGNIFGWQYDERLKSKLDSDTTPAQKLERIYNTF